MPSQCPQWRLPLNFMPIRGPAGTWGWGWGNAAVGGGRGHMGEGEAVSGEKGNDRSCIIALPVAPAGL